MNAQHINTVQLNKASALSRQVLRALTDACTNTVEIPRVARFLPVAPKRGDIEYVQLTDSEKHNIPRTLYALKRRQFIKMKKTGERIIIAITKKGMTEVLKTRCRGASACVPGMSILVIFDIPERERAARSVLRRFLKQCGFTYLQKSVWTTDHDVYDDFKKFIHQIDVAHWVTVLRCTGSSTKK